MGKFYTNNGVPIASDHVRIVHGDRGSYVEFNKVQLEPFKDNFSMPDNAKWRINHNLAYYLEYRTSDGFKIYYQRRTVNYADYKIGLFYISVNDITTNPLLP